MKCYPEKLSTAFRQLRVIREDDSSACAHVIRIFTPLMNNVWQPFSSVKFHVITCSIHYR